MSKRPEMTSSLGQQELDKAEKQFEAFDDNIKQMTMDRMSLVPKLETEAQTNIAQSDLAKMTDIYLKPVKSISSPQKFNENFRKDYEFDKEYVQFIAENKEIIGEAIELWTRPYGGVNAEFWKVPVNKPVWGPRYLAEQIKRKYYHQLTMDQKVITSADSFGQMYGAIAVDKTIQRLDAQPVIKRKSVFMGDTSFK